MTDPDAWYDPPSVELVSSEAMTDFRRSIHDERVVHGMIEDYRAGLSVDWHHDAADRSAGRGVTCPTLVLWSNKDDMSELYGDPKSVWGIWVKGTLSSGSICSGHHVAEEAPHVLAAALQAFLSDQQSSN